MKKSISKRLFLISFGTILFLIIFTMFFQIIFFQKFYLNSKSANLASSVKSFVSDYASDISDSSSLYTALNNFEFQNNAKIAIYSTDGTVKYIANPTNSDSEITITLNKIFNQLYNDPYYEKSVLSSNEVFTTVLDSSSFNSKYIVCMSPFTTSDGKSYIVIAVTSFQNITEATQVIQDFYKYIGIVVIALGLILSYIYSDLISKPLISINKTAKKLSALDFSEKCTVNRDDEIGSLAKTLNFLSQNLYNALEDLKIKNAKLKEEVEKERHLEKLRKDFIAGVSHELKTPIGIISGYAEGIKDGIADDESRDIYLDIIIDEAKKMDKLVMDMLELSKLENGKSDILLSSFSLSKLTQSIITKNSVDINNNNLEIITNINSNYLVIADEFKIEQVITNFLTNAIKYSPAGNKIIVDISEENSIINFSIENTGAYIDEKELSEIWTQFYRGDSSRTRVSKSFGLGLSIVKNI
ncbi:MAG: HAMP domain-containing sensor histidine kinase, partial [Clostridium perfringens]|nr:HAMP domain-containing sensor histidine kinase [Clostridium perfringens]